MRLSRKESKAQAEWTERPGRRCKSTEGGAGKQTRKREPNGTGGRKKRKRLEAIGDHRETPCGPWPGDLVRTERSELLRN